VGRNELSRVVRREWSSVHAFVAAVHEYAGIYSDKESRKEVTTAILSSQYVERHPKDNQLIRFTDDSGDFWEALTFSDSIHRLGG